MPNIVIELFGIPRERAGVAQLALDADTATEALRRLQDACPGLRELVQADGSLSPHYLLSLDGRVFVDAFDEPLPAGSRLLLLSADAGG